jgi:dolichyl-phosphate beta-glucosyltransferase
MSSLRSSILVIPCYNEETRLDLKQVDELLGDGSLGIVFVDDGSKDRTLERLNAIAAKHPDSVTVLPLEKNAGKGEAVRAGCLKAIALGASVVGYADADFSTPPHEIVRLLRVLEQKRRAVVLGSRWARLGSHIERRKRRHYLGRVFATAAAITLDLIVYDTQCGAKWFKVTESLRASFAERFHSRWAFDVELIGRLVGRLGRNTALTQLEDVMEEPLDYWRDVDGSKLSFLAMGKALLDLGRLFLEAHPIPSLRES